MNARNRMSMDHARRYFVSIGTAALVWLIFLAGPLREVLAQETTPPAEPATLDGLEGMHVSQVNLSAAPTIDRQTLLRLIRQKAGAPFSPSAMRESIAALQATKRFSAVQVSIGFGPSGLDVLFILQPTSYVGLISFPGADRAIPYLQLLQAVNIPDQTPYFDGLLSEGTSSLLAFLRRQGYFAADVQPGIERDRSGDLVNLVFRTDLGKRARLGKIRIGGVSSQEASRILSGLGSFWSRLRGRSLKPGQTYSQDRLTNAQFHILADLRSDDRLTAAVQQLPPRYEAGTNRANVSFGAKPGPLVFVRIAGAHLSQTELLRQVPIEAESEVNRASIRQGEENLANYFQSKGYSQVTVRSSDSRESGRIIVRYRVHLGRRFRMTAISFRGNHRFGAERLEAAVAVKTRRALFGFPLTRGNFSEQRLRQSVTSIETLYHNAGFPDVSIHPSVKASGKALSITFNVSEGPENRVAALRIRGERHVPLRELTGNRPLELRRGSPYSPYRLDLDRNQILASYLNLGYLNATFGSTVTPSAGNAHEMNVVYLIHEGRQEQISAVVPLGQTVTRPGFIGSVIAPRIRKGAPLSEGNFLTAESDLYNLGIFDWASVAPLRPTSGQTQDEVLVKVHESKRYTMDIGGGIEVIPRSGNIPVGSVALPGLPVIGLGSKFTVSQKSFFGPRFSFALSRRNMLGRAETATLSTVFSRLDQSGAFTYADPRLWRANWSSLFTLSAERTTENPLYTALLEQASIQAERSLAARRPADLIFRYSFQRTDLSNILIPGLVLPQDQRVRLSTFSAEYIRDTRDNALDAHRGIFQTFDAGITPAALGSSANFVRLLAQNAFYVPVEPWLTWATNVRLGFAIPFANSAVPLSERFFSGGPDSLRGFPINGAGPQRPVQVCSDPSNPSTCALISLPVGGEMLFILNEEARFPLALLRHLEGAFFYDGGNVYKNITLPQWADDYTNTIGAGVRYRTPVGPIRFDVGYRLTAVPGVPALQYFVSFGQSF